MDTTTTKQTKKKHKKRSKKKKSNVQRKQSFSLGVGVEQVRASSLSQNLIALTAIDQHINNILHTNSHVAVYHMNNEHKWDRRDIEGPCFIVQRVHAPIHRFVILNRLNMNDWSMDINNEMNIEIQGDFLFISVPNMPIVGLWFASKTELNDTVSVLTSLNNNNNDSSAFDEFLLSPSKLISSNSSNNRMKKEQFRGYLAQILSSNNDKFEKLYEYYTKGKLDSIIL